LSPSSSGYSGTPLAKKLGFKAGSRISCLGAPKGYLALLGPLPEKVELLDHRRKDVDGVHWFGDKRTALTRDLPVLMGSIKQHGFIWVSWPKKSSKVPTDITEDVIREVALPIGLVDIKVCAVDETWSGLKLVIRKGLRK
jgi:hypothetical protein